MNKKMLCLFVVLFFFFALLTAAAASHEEYFEAGKQAYKNKQYTEAYKNFKAAVNEMPDKAKYQYNLGLAARKLNYYGEAYTAFIKAKELDPGIGFTTKTDDFYKKIEEMRSKAGQTVQKPAAAALSHKEYFEAGKKAYNDKQYKQAYDYFKKAAEQQPGIAKYQYNLGLAARKLNNYKEAYQAFLKAQELDPDLEFTNKRDDFRKKLEEAKYQVDSHIEEKQPIASSTGEVKKEKKKSGFPFFRVAVGVIIALFIIGRIRRKKRLTAAAPPVQGGENLLENDRSRVISSTQYVHGRKVPSGKSHGKFHDHSYDDHRYYDDPTRDHGYKPATGGPVSRRDVS